MISSSNRKMAWLWEALYHSLLETSSCNILRNWLLTPRNTHHCCSTFITFVVWPYGPEWLQTFLSHFNCLRLSIQFTVETECDSSRVEVGSNTSTVALRVVGGDDKGIQCHPVPGGHKYRDQALQVGGVSNLRQ
jgi:hypothetical protein